MKATGSVVAGRALAVLLATWAGGLAGRTAAGQTTRPDDRAAATQPDQSRQDGRQPTVTSAGPVAPSAPAAGEEVKLPAAGTDRPAETKGVPPPIPSADQLVDELLRGEPNAGQPGGPPSTDEVYGSLPIDRVRVGITNTIPGKAGSAVPLDGVPEVKRKLLPEGCVVRDRVGRLRHDRGRFVFVFEADKTGTADPVLVLLPNSLLEAMLNQSNNGQDNVKFRVSGEVTQYQHTNYLLLRMVLIEHNLDRF